MLIVVFSEPRRQTDKEIVTEVELETNINYSMSVIDNLLITMPWQQVLALLRSSQDVETTRNTMKSFVPSMHYDRSKRLGTRDRKEHC